MIPVAAIITSALGNVVEESYLDVSLHRLSYSTLPDYLEGYKIGRISDAHMGLFFSPERLQEAMDALVRQGVQRLEITGDLIDELSLLPACRRVIENNKEIPDNAFVVMLAHHSAFIDEAFVHHIPLTLCGHTHGAQFAPIGPVVKAVCFKYLRGLFRQGESVGYVNRGTGHWLALRVFCLREVSVFELHRN